MAQLHATATAVYVDTNTVGNFLRLSFCFVISSNVAFRSLEGQSFLSFFAEPCLSKSIFTANKAFFQSYSSNFCRDKYYLYLQRCQYLIREHLFIFCQVEFLFASSLSLSSENVTTISKYQWISN